MSVNLKRGFKTIAEQQATQIRQELKLPLSAPLSGENLAKYFGVKIRSADKIPLIPADVKEQLWEADNSSWSAFTIVFNPRKKLVFYNPTHSRGRHESNVMHEMSHLICDHQPSKFISVNGCDFSLRTCDQEQEEEADWLCGCLKLPRQCLIWGIKKGMSTQELANHFGTSFDLAKFRRNVTGVDRQLGHKKK